jgi:p-cumate 2,3-dioxygenase alpha subunit
MIVALSEPTELVSINPEKRSFRVNRQAYKSNEIFEREKKLIFEKCWLYIGHGTELKKKGDFATRRVGGRDLIFIRDRENEIGVFYNTCTHRGAKICRERSGNTRNFTCCYHGWVFNTEGKLVSTNANSGYPEDLNADGHLDLLRVPRLENYRDFYFINYNPKAIGRASDNLIGRA